MGKTMQKRLERIEGKLGLNKPHVTLLMAWYGNEDEPPPPDSEVGGYTLHYVPYKELQQEIKKG